MRLALILPRLVLCAMGIPRPAAAQDTTATRQSPRIEIRESRGIPRDVADDLARIFNAPGTVRVTGTQTIAGAGDVSADIAIIDGTVVIAGRVTGRIVAINSEIVLETAARIDRDVTILGGSLTTRDGAAVVGDVRVYADRVEIERNADRIIVQDKTQDETWYRRRDRWRKRVWSDLRLVSARTYNRVEGLPILIGPTFGREFSWGRLTIDALGVIRSVDNFEWTGTNLGHSLKAEVSVGKRGGIRFGSRLYDLVEPVEPWHLSDAEVGLSSFLLHRDFRDYYDRHGGSLYATLFLGGSTDLTLAYSDEQWGTRAARTPFTVFRGGQGWRPNPRMDDGLFHVVNATWRFDTRNVADDPWSGWYVTADFEHGSGDIHLPGTTSDLARYGGGTAHPNYNRGFLDVRRYNRTSPDHQLNVRLVLGGWLSGNELPLQRRLSLGGPGTLPGYDFRRTQGNTDYWQCSARDNSVPFPVSGSRYPPGIPAQCERVALAQVEYRGSVHVDPLGLFGEQRDRRRRGWGRDAEWVVFADAGRGWLVGRRLGDIQYGETSLPPLGTFRTDVGIGLRLDDIGLYVAKSVSDLSTPPNFFVRLRPRF